MGRLPCPVATNYGDVFSRHGGLVQLHSHSQNNSCGSNSLVECHLDMVEAVGPIPTSRTIISATAEATKAPDKRL